MTITADFSGGEKTVTTEPLYQWDTGQKLALSGLPATSTDIQVHFANAAMAQAIVKATELVGSLPTCDIPNEFLQFGSAAKARAWVFYRASDTEGYTVRTVLIPVTPRKRPNDYVSPEDPDSKGIVDRAIELLEGYEDDLASKLSAAPGAVDTENLADESVTVEKVADDLAAVINTKEVKSNKKTTLTGNESNNDFYPTTKAVADALSTKLTVKPIPEGGYDDCTESNTLYYGYVGGYYAYVLPVVVTGSSNQSQHKLRTDNGLVEHRARHYSNGAWGAWGSWTPAGVDSEITYQIVEAYIAEHGIDLTGVERTENKVTTIGSGLTNTQYPSAKAVVDYLVANYENLSNKLTSANGIDENSTNMEYPSAKAVFDFGVQIIDFVNEDISAVQTLINGKESTSNKLTSEAGIDSGSTDAQYPTAKAVYDLGVEILALMNDDISNVESRLVLKESASNKQSSITAVNKASTALYPSIKAVVDYLVANYENSSNKVTAVNSSASDTQYPSAKAVYTELSGKADKSNTYTKSEVDTAIQTAIGGVENGSY